MGKVYVDFDEGTPRYVCTECCNCNSLTGLSLCSIKTRGCCSYFPEFTLVDIQKMGNIKDKTLFFRTCPFVKAGHGCSLPVRFRNHVCNLYLCDEIVYSISQDSLKPYVEERSRYARWIYRENMNLEHLLRENGVSLTLDISRASEILRAASVYNYEFPYLEPVEIIDEWHKGA